MIDLGMVKPGRTIRIPFGSYDGGTGASAVASAFVAADIKIYKDGGTVARASASGITATTTFSSITGINTVFIDLADNTTANFYEAGSEYFVIVGPITIDAQTVEFPIGRFDIGYVGAVLNTTISALTSQTSFTLEDGSAITDAYTDFLLLAHQLDDEFDIGYGFITGYTSGRVVTLSADPVARVLAVGDHIALFLPANVEGWNAAPVQVPTVAGVPNVDVTQWSGTAVPTPTTTGVPDVNVERWLDALVTLSASVPDVNVQSSDLTAALVNLIWDEAMVETTGAPAITGSMRDFMEWWAALSRNVINQTATLTTLRNDADAVDLSTSIVSDDATTFIRGEFST